MLLEITVRNFGVIGDASITFSEGMTALTGETGAGKSLIVDAIDLLTGGRADRTMVAAGAEQATVDGRFELDGTEIIISRVIDAAEGRSRAYVDGRPQTVSALGELGSKLVDLHGQHSHQSLLSTPSQRDSLDRYGAIDTTALDTVRSEIAELCDRLDSMGGDDTARARELDLVKYQVDELVAAELSDPKEDLELRRAEELLGNAEENLEVLRSAQERLAGESSARDELANLANQFRQTEALLPLVGRLDSLIAEIDDVAGELRSVELEVDADPAQLVSIQARRQVLTELRRKYGNDLATVIDERDRLQRRLKELSDFDGVASQLQSKIEVLKVTEAKEAAKILEQRASAAPKLAKAVETHLANLDMSGARLEISVAGADGSAVEFLLAANPGSKPAPLAKVASGGELSRTMLALRSVLSEAPPVLIFDEVDAGIGGTTGTAIGQALVNLADRHQVVVVTHLAQVAAFATAHKVVRKATAKDSVDVSISNLERDDRVTELARMLSGKPDSASAREHAEELLG